MVRVGIITFPSTQPNSEQTSVFLVYQEKQQALHCSDLTLQHHLSFVRLQPNLCKEPDGRDPLNVQLFLSHSVFKIPTRNRVSRTERERERMIQVYSGRCISFSRDTVLWKANTSSTFPCAGTYSAVPNRSVSCSLSVAASSSLYTANIT